jgi:hypothetical protein
MTVNIINILSYQQLFQQVYYYNNLLFSLFVVNVQYKRSTLYFRDLRKAGGGWDPEDRITFTSNSPEGYHAPGDWYGIWYRDGAGAGTLLDNCVVSYAGGYGSNSGNLTINSATAEVPIVTDCEITISSSWGIYQAAGTSPTLSGISCSNNALGNIHYHSAASKCRTPIRIGRVFFLFRVLTEVSVQTCTRFPDRSRV